MARLTLPRHLPMVEIVGLCLSLPALLVPQVRHPVLIGLVLLLYFYCAFWGVVETHQRGLLGKNVRQIYEHAKTTPERTRLAGFAFSLVGTILIVKVI